MEKKDLVEVQTEYGPIQGCTLESCLGRKYFNFQKVPYMKPPVGKLRFCDPQPPESWSEKLNCTEQSEAFCNMNFLTRQYEGKLDAMYINVYTNEIKPKKPYPVMVWVNEDIFLNF
jgi:cholinesterase